jgi:Ca-activated chloride channel homolog
MCLHCGSKDHRLRRMAATLIAICTLVFVSIVGATEGKAQGISPLSRWGETSRHPPPTPEALSLAPKPSPASLPIQITVEKTLVLVNVLVMDRNHGIVTGLKENDFRLFEDGVEQHILHFSTEEAPVSIGIVFDTSTSMGSKLAKSREAVAEFLKTSNPADEFFFLSFNNRPELSVPFTTDTDAILKMLMLTRCGGRTALLDSIYFAVHKMKEAHNGRKALFLISDGGDNDSRYTETEVHNAILESDVQVFAVGILEPTDGRHTHEELVGPALLNDLAEETGGRGYTLDNLKELPGIARSIGIALRNEYVLAYTPTNCEHDGRYRHVKVKLNRTQDLPPLKAYFRHGYYAPTR